MEPISFFYKAENSPSKDKNILVGETVYIVGHEKPDLDSIASALGYQMYRHSQGDFNYIAIYCGDINPVTEWVFKKFKTQLPMQVPNVSGMQLVLVDHSDPESRPPGWENAKILEVLDHHKLKLETVDPPKITVRPYGSTATLVAQKMVRARLPIKPEIASVLLAAILDDTLALRAPTTTQVDKSMAGELAIASSIGDLNSFARELFKQKDIWGTLSITDIIEMDIKDFDVNGKKVVISQVETMDNRKLEKKELEIIEELNRMNEKEPVSLRMVMLTDLLRNDCILLVVGENLSILEDIFHAKLQENKMYLPGVLSRKKQILPPLLEMYS